MAEYQHHPASFRDPSGFIFFAKGNYYRQVNQSYATDFERLMSSGLYESLVKKKLLIAHEISEENFGHSTDWYKTLIPQQISFISYPYEWCFDALKDAALLTLSILKISIDHGMILKDATPFNVQFYKGKPIFIDSLSFEKYDELKPWIAYRQFCECFLFPLFIGHYLKTDIQKLLSIYLDGIPVSITAKLLPAKSKLNLGVWLHVFLQNSIAAKNKSSASNNVHFSKQKLTRLIDHLENSIKGLRIDSSIKSTWNNYYDETILSSQYLNEKEKIFRELTEDVEADSALDLGCNNGYFSEIIAGQNVPIIAIDFDSQCINQLYLSEKNKSSSNILPLCIDLSNPSPGVGFRNAERSPFEDRGKSDLVIALAIVHHLVLSKNIPLPDVARLMSDFTKRTIIIEFVPLNDPKSQQLISNKTNYHQPYDVNAFEIAFSKYFKLERKEVITGTERILYRMGKV
ncbi:MAG: SAM-dependent methyltransferase [Bacteroidetes bacterium]|nr:SAM-dependent methyltransferase [Bacteroidota bacterium]